MSSGQPLRLWLAWRFALAGILPLLLVAALLLWVLLPQVLQEIETRHQALARAISGQVEVHLRSAERELLAVAEFLRQRGYQPVSLWFEPVLDAHAGAGEVFAAIYVAAADDSVYAVGLPQARRSQRDDLLEIDLSRWPVVREARERKAPVWSEVFLSAVSARLAVSLAIPVGEQVLIGEVAIDRLSKFLSALPNEAGMLTMILDRRGQVIAHSRSSLGGPQLNLGHLPIVADALQGRFDGHTLEIDGEQFLADLVMVPQVGWMVLVAQPRSGALGPFMSTWWALAAGALVALLLAISITVALARRFAHRLGRYTAQAHAIAEGDYEQHWPISRIRELDSLAGDLDRMSQAIRQRQQQLESSEERYRSVISNAPVVIFQFDEEGVFQLSEGRGLATVGLVPGQAVGQSLFTLYRDYPEICAHARRAIRGEALQFVARVGEIAFDTYFNPVSDRDGRVRVIGVAVDISARMRAEEDLRQANLVVENSPAMLFRWRAAEGWPTVFVSHNVRQLGYSPEDLLDESTPFACLIHPADLQRVASEVQAYSDHGLDHFEQEYRIVTRDGATRWVDDHTAIERNSDGEVTHYQGIVIDISERKRAEAALGRVNRQLRMISECGQALIRTSHEVELLKTVCRIVVEVGAYRMAWVAYVDDDTSGALQAVAHAGDEAGYLDGVNWADSGCGTEAAAMRDGRPCVIQNIASDPRFAPGRVKAAARGYAALCALPLQAGERTLGVLSIYASVADAFDSEEVVLLSELAGDLAFGIMALRTRIERDKNDAALRESEFLLRRSQEVGDLGSYHFDVPADTWIGSEKLDQIFGIDESFPKTAAGWIELVHPDDRAMTLAHLQEHVLTDGQRFDLRYRVIRRSDGQERWVHGLGELEFDEDGLPIKLIGTIQDISASRQADQALHESEARYRLLFDSNPHPMWVCDRETLEFLTVNDAAVASYGYSREEFLHMTLMDLGAGEETPLLSEDVVAVEERGDYAGFGRHCRKDGTVIDVDIVSHALSFQGRKAELVLVDDITERKRSEQALLQSELKYRELVENANSIILRLNPEGRITFINEFGLKFFGYSEEELLDRPVVGTITPLDASKGSALRPMTAELCRNPVGSERGISENMRRSGERVWVAWTNKAIFDDWGRVVEVFSVGSDVTDRMRAEAAVRESEERFAKAFHASPAAMCITEIETGRFIDVNAQLQRMLCYSRDQMIGHTSPELGVWADPGTREQMIAQVLAQGSCREMPTRFRTSAGDIRETLWSGEIIRLGEQEVLLSLIFDITERKRAEEELQRHREHLEDLVDERTSELRQAMAQLVQAEKLAALGNLVAGVAHELNTPLGNTRVVASLLGEQLREFATAVEAGTLRRSQVEGFLGRGREAVDLLERNSARAADLVGHFKQVAVDQSSARRRSFDLRQTVDEMLVTLRLTFKHTRHRIEVDIPAGLEMDSYPGPLEQVIANLVANSLKHGFVGIDEGRVELHAHALGETHLLLRYVDNGVGIAKGTVHRVFEPFFTTRLGRGGSGLGLYIAYNLVTGVLGGTIEVESSPGHGVSFTLSMPRRAPERTTPA